MEISKETLKELQALTHDELLGVVYELIARVTAIEIREAHKSAEEMLISNAKR